MALISIVCDDGVPFDQKERIVSVLKNNFPEMSFEFVEKSEMGSSAHFVEPIIMGLGKNATYALPHAERRRMIIGVIGTSGLSELAASDFIEKIESRRDLFPLSFLFGGRGLDLGAEIADFKSILLKEKNWEPDKGVNPYQRGYCPNGSIKTKGAFASQRLSCRRLMPSLSGHKTPVPKAQAVSRTSSRFSFKPHQMV